MSNVNVPYTARQIGQLTSTKYSKCKNCLFPKCVSAASKENISPWDVVGVQGLNHWNTDIFLAVHQKKMTEIGKFYHFTDTTHHFITKIPINFLQSSKYWPKIRPAPTHWHFGTIPPEMRIWSKFCPVRLPFNPWKSNFCSRDLKDFCHEIKT